MCTACSCATDTATTDLATPSGDVTEYKVTGMTCGHCVGSVTEQIQQIEGVRDVAVDLSTGAVLVTGDRPVAADAVAAAVRKAGYQVA